MIESKQSPIVVPTHLDLMWPTLTALKALGGSGTNQEILDKIIENEHIPEAVQASAHTKGNMTKLEYRAAWARTYLKLGGAITNSDVGVWAVTETGENISKKDLLKIVQEKRRQYYVNRKINKNRFEELPEEPLDNEYVEEADWKSQLLSVLGKIHSAAFERLCQRILRESGFVKVEVTGKSGDGGIDGKGILRVNLLSFPVFFQCKRYKGSVGSGVVRDFRGAMAGRGEKGLLITTGSFTAEARKEATREGATPIDLIDGEDLCDLLKKLKLGIQVHMIENIAIEHAWYERI